jgi:membrane associated rhomboid family serine protease
VVLPIGDAPNPRGVPVATYLLIALNVAVYVLITLPLSAVRPAPNDPLLLDYLHAVSHAVDGRVPIGVLARQTTAYDLFVFTHGFRPVHPSLVDLFVSLFLHAGLMHLAGNMLFLWIYGDNVERRLGIVRYLVAYLGTGVAATIAHWAGAPDSALPVVGASGAISGILGFYFLWFPRNIVRLLWLIPPFIGQVIEVPARIVLGFYLVADNLLPYLFTSGEGGVAHGAHIGGFVAGVGLAWLADRRGVGSGGAVHYETRSVPVAGDDVGALIDAGQLREAAAIYLGQSMRAARGTLAPEQALVLATWLRRAAHPEAAAVVLRRLVRDVRDERMLARAHLALGQVLLEDLDQPTPAYQHFLAVLDLDADPDTVAAARAGLASVAARQKRTLGWQAPQ